MSQIDSDSVSVSWQSHILVLVKIDFEICFRRPTYYETFNSIILKFITEREVKQHIGFKEG